MEMEAESQTAESQFIDNAPQYLLMKKRKLKYKVIRLPMLGAVRLSWGPN